MDSNNNPKFGMFGAPHFKSLIESNDDANYTSQTKQNALRSVVEKPTFKSGLALAVADSSSNRDEEDAQMADQEAASSKDSEEERLEQLLNQMQRAFDRPVVSGKIEPRNSELTNLPSLAQYCTARVEFKPSDSNQSTITNPRALLEVFEPNVFLRSGLSERSQGELIDRLMDIINGCLANNCHTLTDLMTQPIELLSCQPELFDQGPIQQSDIVRQYISYNDMNLYKTQLQATAQAVRANNLMLIQRYALKNNQREMADDNKPTFDSSAPADFLMLMIYLGAKLASQQLSEQAAKIVHVCHVLSEGYRFQRQHLQFLVQYVRQKGNKILKMKAELEEMQASLQAHKSSNKVALQAQLLVEKEAKLKSILSYALSMISGLNANRKDMTQSHKAFGSSSSESSRVSNYFYFSGADSGLEYNRSSLNKIKDQLASSPDTISWPFQKGFTAVIKFKCHKQGVQLGQIHGESIGAQSFNPMNLPVLFNCFSEGYGGFECYLNPNYQVIYRVLPRSYSPPTIESNGVKVADVQLDAWSVLVLEHDKPYLARAQLLSIMNDRQSTNLPMDYPKFDQKALLSNVIACKGVTAHLAFFALFKDRFTHLKKFVSQLLKLDQFDEVILKNEISLNQYFSDQSGSSQQFNFYDKLCLLYSPLRATPCQAFQCVQPQENQYSHQVSNDMSLMLLFNSGVHLSKVENEFDINQLLPFLEIILSQEGNISGIVNQWLKLVCVHTIASNSFIESVFHILTTSLRNLKRNARTFVQVDVDSINLLAEIRYQLLDDKSEQSKQLHFTFFKCLLQSTDFWINQSLVAANGQALNEQFWLLVKTIYAQDPAEYNQLFPIHILITLMNEIGMVYTQDTGATHHCCFYHQETSKLLTHKGLRGTERGGANQGLLNGHQDLEEDFEVIDMPNEGKEAAADNVTAKKAGVYSVEGESRRTLVFFPEGFDQSQSLQDLEFDVQRLLEPITAVLEAVLNASCGQFKVQQQPLEIHAGILDSVKFIALALTNSRACPCFQLQMLKLLRLVLVDSKDQEVSQIFAQRFIKENGLQVLLFVCSISVTFDVKSLCIKLIDVLCSRHTNLIKMIRIDTDLISYLSEIMIPRTLEQGIDFIKRKRYMRLKLKREQDLERAQNKKEGRMYFDEQVQIVDYQEDQVEAGAQEKVILNESEMHDEEGHDEGEAASADEAASERQSVQMSRNDMHVKLNSLEERQLDRLFGAEDEMASDQQQDAIEYDAIANTSYMDDEQQESIEEAAKNEIEKQFAEATGGLRMPPAPKSKIVPKFDFDALSSNEGSSEAKDSAEDNKGELLNPQPKPKVGGFDFGLMVSDDEQNDAKSSQFRLPAPKLGGRAIASKPDNSKLQSRGNQMMLQSQKLPGLKDLGREKKQGHKKLQINLSSGGEEQSDHRRNSKSVFDEEDKPSSSERNQDCREPESKRDPSLEETPMEPALKPKAKFQNENAMAGSNLRQKDKKFNFGGFAGMSDSESEEPEQTINFFSTKQVDPEPEKEDSDEEMQLRLMMNRKKDKNPFASRIGKQELQPSQIRKNKQAALKLQQTQKAAEKSVEANIQQEKEKKSTPTLCPPGTSAKPPVKFRQNFIEVEEDAPSASEHRQDPTSRSETVEAELAASDQAAVDLTLRPPQSRELDYEAFECSKPTAGTNRRGNTKKMVKKNFKTIGIDTDAINELYTYGGEQGKKKESQENELMDFENGILELASQCLAAMKREKPTDPIFYDENKQSIKRSFEQKFQLAESQDDSDNEYVEKQAECDDQPNYFRPNFNVPQTMRGIKNLALSVGGLKSSSKNAKVKANPGAYVDFGIKENDLEDEENEDNSYQRLPLKQVSQLKSSQHVHLQEQGRIEAPPKPKSKLQIIDYDLIQDQDDIIQVEHEQEAPLLPFKTEKSQSQKSEADFNNNSKFEAVPESFGEISQSRAVKHILYECEPKEMMEPLQETQEETESDRRDQELLEQFDNEQTTQELSNLYTSCLEWILGRPVSGLNAQLMIDDYDKIQQPAALELLMNLVGQSNNLLRQRALLDFYMLAQWDVQNGYILLFHQKFHSWLLDLLLPYQQFIDEQDENCRAVYDMGCKLHTLLVTNSCINPEQEAFKKLNLISRYPLTVPPDTRTIAEKLSRVLLINLVSNLQPHLSSGDTSASMCAWRNFIHIVQLSEEMMYASSDLHQSQSEEDKKNINLNLSLLDWQRKHLMYFETGAIYENKICEVQWAEWEMLDTLFEGLELLYKKLGIVSVDERAEAASHQLLSSQQYQVSTQIIQEKVFESLERFYQTSQFEQDVQLLMRECLVGSQTTPRGGENLVSQAVESQLQSNSSKFSFPGGRLKGLKLQFQQQHNQSGTANQSQAAGQQLLGQKQQCLVDSVMNMLCTALVEGQTKEAIQKWLNKLECFMRYIMLLSETLSQQKSEHIYQKVQLKFSNVLTFGFAFLFNQLHSTNYQVSNQSQALNNFYKPPTSNTSSPKDYQATNRLFSLTLKNLMIYFVNIVDYKEFCRGSDAGQASAAAVPASPSAVQHIFSKILVNKISDHESSLITLDDIKRYKATNFEDFPECFGHEDWKVTFFHNKEITQIVREQMSQQMIEELFLKRRQTYSKGISEMNTRSEKTKEDIQKRIHADTNQKISEMSEMASDQRVVSKLQIYVQSVHSKRQYALLRSKVSSTKGLWANYGPRYLKSTNKGFAGFGVKAFMKERPSNGFEFIENAAALEQKLFTHIESSLDVVRPTSYALKSDSSSPLFCFFESQVDRNTILRKREHYIQLVKLVSSLNKTGQKEIMQANCVLMKAFYQAKGALILTSEQLAFVYVDEPRLTNPNEVDVRNQDRLFFFKKLQQGKKLFKLISLESIREIQRRRFAGFKRSLEIFMVDNSSYLIQFESTEERDAFSKKMLKLRGSICKNLRYYDSFDPKKIIKKRELTDRWRQWRISNFNYLMQLNYLGGRSQNDLSQYPVFPWVFSNYALNDPGTKLDITSFTQFYQRGDAPPRLFRDLSKNMQLLGSAERQAEFKRKFEDIDGFLDFNDRFHCGSHYSNPGITLHYLARVSPFIDALVELQGMNHDNPDRAFHSLLDSYQNALKDFSDVREILPEFFYLPEMYLNQNRINFGRRQDKQLVSDVVLPDGCNQNPYKFVVAMREALESNYVSQNICKWIDYIFGYKQLGPDAERSLNTFSSVTYEDKIDLEKLAETDPHVAESYQLQMYNYGQTPTNVVQFKLKEHPPKKYREEVFKYSLVTDQFANLKVYRPVNKKKSASENNKATVLAHIQQGRLPLIQRKAIIKAQFVNEGLIAAARVDGKMRFYMWVNQANDLNPLTPFTCGKEKKRLYDYALSPVILQNDITLSNLNKPLLILNRGKLVISGGHWGGQLAVSYTQEVQQEASRARSNSQQLSGSQSLAQVPAHTSTCTVIASTIEDPNKIVSKSQQSSSSTGSLSDNCLVITGSKAGDVIVWRFQAELAQNPASAFTKHTHFFDHDSQVTSIFLHQEMQYFATSSTDGTCNLYNLVKLELLRCFRHPSLNPVATVILSCQPLVCLAMFSQTDRTWISHSINGQNLNDLEDPETVLKNCSEESSQIVAPKVIQNAHFLERLIYGTEKGYIVIRELPFMAPLKRISISTNNLIQPVLTFIVSKDRRFLLVGCGEGGLTVITEPFSSAQGSKQKAQPKIQSQNISATQQSQGVGNLSTQGQILGGTPSQGQSSISHGGQQLSHFSQATSRTDAQNSSFVSNATFTSASVHSASIQQSTKSMLSSIKGHPSQSINSNSIYLSSSTKTQHDTSLSFAGQPAANLSLRQSIASNKKLSSKIPSKTGAQQNENTEAPDLSQMTQNSCGMGVATDNSQGQLAMRGGDGKSPAGPRTTMAPSSSAAKAGVPSSTSVPAASGTKLRINTGTGVRQSSSGKQGVRFPGESGISAKVSINSSKVGFAGKPSIQASPFEENSIPGQVSTHSSSQAVENAFKGISQNLKSQSIGTAQGQQKLRIDQPQAQKRGE